MAVLTLTQVRINTSANSSIIIQDISPDAAFSISTDGFSSSYHVGSGASRLRIFDYSAPFKHTPTNTHLIVNAHTNISSLLIVGGGCSGADISNYIPAGYQSKGGDSGNVQVYSGIYSTVLTGGNASITNVAIQLGGGGVIPSSNSYETNPGGTTTIGVSSDYESFSGGYSAVGGTIASGKGSGSSAVGRNGGIGTQWVDGLYYGAGGGEGGNEIGGTSVRGGVIPSGTGGSSIGGDGRVSGGKPGTGSGGGAGFHGGSGCVKIAVADPE